jgi:signal transduction histidine kinase
MRYWVTDLKASTLPERYQRLLELSQDLASTLDLDSLLSRIVKAAAELCNAEAASILLYDQVKEQLYFRAASNMDTPLMSELIVPVTGSVAGWIITNRQPVILNNAQKDPRHFGNVGKITQISTKSLLGVPLLRKERVIGVLETINKLRGKFDAEDQDLLLALGAQAAIAIENARLFQQSDLISEFVHEIRTPLASLTAAAYILLRPEIPEERRTNIVQTMQQEVSRLSDMASAFLDLARLESGRVRFQFTSVDLGDLIEECSVVIRSKIEEKSQDLQIQPSPDPIQISADRDKLKQVILNLLSNAHKYTPSGGRIALSFHSTSDEVIIQVSDTGCGIPAEYMQHMFEKFYRVPTTEYVEQGSGLGLFICKHIVDAHGGRIAIDSTAGHGTTVSVRLPFIS